MAVVRAMSMRKLLRLIPLRWWHIRANGKDKFNAKLMVAVYAYITIKKNIFMLET